MSEHPFHFLSQAYSYPKKDTIQQYTKTLSLLATDLDIETSLLGEPGTFSLQDLEIEYTRLFINAADGIFAPPYASIYVNDSGLLRQQGYDESLTFYSEAGLAPLESDESPDHIAHELAFVGLLLDKKQDDLLDRFLAEHLLLWYPKFLQRLLAASPCPFYRVLGQVTDLCLRQN